MMYFIGADLGTSALKLLLCKKDGEIISSVSKSYNVCYPHPGWSEQDPYDWWNAFVEGVRELTAGVDKSKIVALSVAGQMHGLVILDKEDEVIRPAILWNDGRTHAETDYLNFDVGESALLDMTANIAFAGFTAPKILWVKNNEPESFARISKIMLPKDYINYRLTGIHACDYSDASGMLLLDVEKRCWSKRMLDLCGISEEQMPLLFESFESIGTLSPNVAEALGLSSSVIVAAGAGDNAGAAIGTGTIGNGRCNISLGTSGTVFISSDEFVCDRENALHYFCHADGRYHIMGCMLSAASCNKWFCDNVLRTGDYADAQKNITDDDLGKNQVYFLPYLMGERSPINDTNATGVFIGLRPDTTAEDMLLAILEGVCFAIRDNIDVVRKTGVEISYATVCGGGARSPLWIKILANVLNMELSLLENEEGPALGAVYLAAVAAKEYPSINSVPTPSERERVRPDASLAALYQERYSRFKKIYPTMKNLFKEIKE